MSASLMSEMSQGLQSVVSTAAHVTDMSQAWDNHELPLIHAGRLVFAFCFSFLARG